MDDRARNVTTMPTRIVNTCVQNADTLNMVAHTNHRHTFDDTARKCNVETMNYFIRFILYYLICVLCVCVSHVGVISTVAA